MWTKFWDMHSGGGLKEKWDIIYIEAPKKEAKVIFYNRFKHNPERVTCTCCGEDYSINEYKDLTQATGFHRHCAFKNNKYVEETDIMYSSTEVKLIPFDQYIKQKNVKVIYAKDINSQERTGEIPEQGYIWKE